MSSGSNFSDKPQLQHPHCSPLLFSKIAAASCFCHSLRARANQILHFNLSEITELTEWRGSSAKHALPRHLDSGSSALISQGDWHPVKTELLEHQVPSAHSRCDITRTHDTTPLSLQPSQVRLERHTKFTWLSLENPCTSAAKYSTHLTASGLAGQKNKKNKFILGRYSESWFLYCVSSSLLWSKTDTGCELFTHLSTAFWRRKNEEVTTKLFSYSPQSPTHWSFLLSNIFPSDSQILPALEVFCDNSPNIMLAWFTLWSKSANL